MTTEEMIRAAKDAIGSGRTDDYVIQPTKHAAELLDKAPSLAAMLGSSELSVLAGEYEKKDKEAKGNKNVFMITANRANWAVLLTACFSTLLLVVAPLKAATGLPDAVILAVLGVCGVISGGLGSMWVYQAREGRLLDNWMSARAAAEALRTQYFETATGMELPDGNSPIPTALLQFEYFRRYQLDVQIAFYERKAQDLRRDADRLLRTGAFSVALASISAGLAAILGGQRPAWVSVAALGAIATALGSFAATRESVNQSRRNMERYTKACEAISLLKRKLDPVRAAAAAGDKQPMKQFIAAVHEQLTAEHREWLAAAQSIQPAIDRLEDTLAKLKPKPADAQPAANVPSH